MISYQELDSKVKEYDRNLLALDTRFGKDVTIIHTDGSYFHFHSAFLMKKDDFIICFTEHFGPHIYHKDDLVRYYQSEKFSVDEDF